MNVFTEIWRWLGDSKEQIVSISALIGVFIAFSGLRTWHKELKGKAEYQKAKDVLKAVYRAKDAFMVVRSPWMDSSEYPKDILDDMGRLRPGKEFEAKHHAYKTRLKVLDDAFAILEEQAWDAHVEWGDEFQNVIIPLRRCRAELLVAIHTLLETKSPITPRDLSADERKEMRQKLYFSGENFDLDPFTSQIGVAVKAFEIKLRPHINRPSFLNRINRHPLVCAIGAWLLRTARRFREEMDSDR